MRIDLYQDTVCPWCRIGKKNLQLALAQWGGDAEIHYHTFFLNPDVPTEGYDFREYLSAKMGIQPGQLSQVFDGPTRMGAAVGLEFNFDQIERSPNSLLSHRLIALAPADQREALLLVCVEQLSYAEVAEVMSIPMGTVMSRVCRARAVLRRFLDGSARPAMPALRRVV